MEQETSKTRSEVIICEGTKNKIITIHYYRIACLYDLIIITKSYADLERESSTLADDSLSNLLNSLDHTQSHSIIANL